MTHSDADPQKAAQDIRRQQILEMEGYQTMVAPYADELAAIKDAGLYEDISSFQYRQLQLNSNLPGSTSVSIDSLVAMGIEQSVVLEEGLAGRSINPELATSIKYDVQLDTGPVIMTQFGRNIAEVVLGGIKQSPDMVVAPLTPDEYIDTLTNLAAPSTSRKNFNSAASQDAKLLSADLLKVIQGHEVSDTDDYSWLVEAGIGVYGLAALSGHPGTFSDVSNKLNAASAALAQMNGIDPAIDRIAHEFRAKGDVQGYAAAVRDMEAAGATNIRTTIMSVTILSNLAHNLHITRTDAEEVRDITSEIVGFDLKPEIMDLVLETPQPEEEPEADSEVQVIDVRDRLSGGMELPWKILPEGTLETEARRIVEDAVARSTNEHNPPRIELERLDILESLRDTWGRENTYYVSSDEDLEDRKMFTDGDLCIADEYIGLVIQQRDPETGTLIEHLVAESPIAGPNAVYIARGDVSKSGWKDVMASTKVDARNKQARAIKHTLSEGETNIVEVVHDKVNILLNCKPEEFKPLQFKGKGKFYMPDITVN